jgi:septal ring factor EnvC (AmiA/AmiB activator)
MNSHSSFAALCACCHPSPPQEQDLGVTNTLHQITQCLEQHQAQIQEGVATARQQAADIAALQEDAGRLQEEQGQLQNQLQEVKEGLAQLETQGQAAAVDVDNCQKACLVSVW